MSRLPTQRETNPFPYSDSDKRYHTFDYYLRKTYGGKCAVIPLDAGLSCPNIDGTRGVGGCIYCSGRGSGDFAGLPTDSLAEQYRKLRERVASKWDCKRFLPYLQAHTNTHTDPMTLRRILDELAALPDAAALHIATRGDCIDGERAALLAALAREHDVTVELGLQSASDTTAARINRCHTYAEFLEGYHLLRKTSPRIRICIHLINGLPGESEEDMLASAAAVAAIRPDEVKLHLLHVLRGTHLAELFERGEYLPMTREAYTDTIVRQLELFPPETVIGRLTGDGAREALLAPLWSLKKFTVLNQIDRLLYTGNTFQGRLFSESND